ncbi:glycosyltransferase family 2 protein [Actinomadura luteofluorescens]|uniref:glycosyltransferase family 2 protein n=1 Tax=Actinomadura luteofluorescens TaxID=46163 RepID=UPI00362CC29F
MELSVVMPCLNEAETVETCVRKTIGFFEDSGIDGEVVIADNGSTDGSQQLARDAGARVVPVVDKGYGNALMGGIRSARGRYVAMGDADDSYDFTTLGPFLDELRDGADLVMGNRFKGGIADGAMPPLHRYLGNPVLSFVGRCSSAARSATSTAGCAPSTRKRSCGSACRPAAWSSPARWSSRRPCRATTSARCRPRCRRTAGPAPRTSTPGATGGATCASSCSTARAGSSSSPAWSS